MPQAQVDQKNSTRVVVEKSWRILSIALALSVLGHLFVFFGLPFWPLSFSNDVPDDLIIRTELKLDPPKKIKISNTVKKKLISNSTSSANLENSNNSGDQSGPASQAGVAFRLPESGILYYDAFLDGKPIQTGEIDWETDGNSYRLYINIPYAFVGPFVFESRGSVDAYGIAPSIYWSQRGTKPPRYTRFDRDGKGGGQIFFSEKPDFSPDILPGTQDRFSLMFQFASLLNGESRLDEAGTIKEIPVVDYNTLEMWQFKSYGETVSDVIPSLGNSVNRHYALMQRESDPYKRRIDFWLAKDLEWLPGKIRSQDANGRVVELIFKQKSPLPKSNTQ